MILRLLLILFYQFLLVQTEILLVSSAMLMIMLNNIYQLKVFEQAFLR